MLHVLTKGKNKRFIRKSMRRCFSFLMVVLILSVSSLSTVLIYANEILLEDMGDVSDVENIFENVDLDNEIVTVENNDEIVTDKNNTLIDEDDIEKNSKSRKLTVSENERNEKELQSANRREYKKLYTESTVEESSVQEYNDLLVQAGNYNAQAALNYAKNHWNDGVGLCAEFVSNCIKAGGSTAWSRSASDLRGKLLNSGMCVEYVSSTTNGNVLKSNYKGDAEPGDVIFWKCAAETDGKPYVHTALFSGWASSGYMKCYAHNSARNDAVINYVKCGYCEKNAINTLHLLHFKDNTKNQSPIGAFDVAENNNGKLRVRGWAFDPDNPSKTVKLHVYVGGPAGSGSKGYVTETGNLERNDVVKYYPNATVKCGFDRLLDVSERGNKDIYVYAIDTEGGDNKLLESGSKDHIAVNITEPLGITTSVEKIELECGTLKTFSFNWQGTGFDYVQVTWDDGSVISADYDGSFVGTGGKIKVTANKVGNTKLNILLMDKNYAVMFKKNISVVVKGSNYVEFNYVKTSVMEDTETSLPFSINGNGATKVTFSSSNTQCLRILGFEDEDKNFTKATNKLKVKGLKNGTSIVQVLIFDANGKEIASTQCSVYVSEKLDVIFKEDKLAVRKNLTKDFDITYKGTGTKGHMEIKPADASMLEANVLVDNFGQKNGKIRLRGKKVGKSKISISLWDAQGDQIYVESFDVSILESADIKFSGFTGNEPYFWVNESLTVDCSYDDELAENITFDAQIIEGGNDFVIGTITTETIGTDGKAHRKVTVRPYNCGDAVIEVTLKGTIDGQIVDVVSSRLSIHAMDIEINPRETTGVIGEKDQIKVDLGISSRPLWLSFNYTSKNTNVAKVDSNGLITMVGAGTTIVLVESSDGKVEVGKKIIVSSKPIDQTGISIAVKSNELKLGESTQVTATVYPTNATNKTVTYSSSNTNVASVDSVGNITAKSTGVAVIYGKTANGKYQSSSTISVYLDGGKSSGLNWKITGTEGNYTLNINGTGKMRDFVSYTSDDWRKYSNKVNSLNIEEGITTIGKYAFYNFQDIKGKLTIPRTVTEIGDYAFAGCEDISSELVLPTGLKFIHSYAFAYCYGLKGSIEIPNNIQVIESNAFRNCSGISGRLVLGNNVSEIGNNAFLNTGIQNKVIFPESLSSIGNMAFKGVPCKEFIFKGNAPNVIAASSNKPTFEGNVNIYYINSKTGWSSPKWMGYTANVVSGEQSEEVKVSEIKISKSVQHMIVGSVAKLEYKITPSNATDKIVMWKSSDESVANVDENGFITALSTGKTIVEVTSNDGKKTASCEVYVVSPDDVSIETEEDDFWVWAGEAREVKMVIKGSGYDDVSLREFNNDLLSMLGDQNKTTSTSGNGAFYTRTDVIKQSIKGNEAGIVPLVINFSMKDGSSYENVLQKFINIKVVDLKLSAYYSYLEPGESFNLKYSIYPEIENNINVEFKSDNPIVASITDNGRVTALSEGVANIVVQTADGKIVKECEVVVLEKAHDKDYEKTNIGASYIDISISENSFEYTGEEIEPEVKIEDLNGGLLLENTDYTVSYRNNINVGKAYIVVNGIGDYYGSVSKEFKIQGDISDSTITLEDEEFKYTGKSIEPNVTVTFPGSGILAENVDYNLMYRNNINMGTARLTVIGLNNYKGSKDVTFLITEKGSSSSRTGKNIADFDTRYASFSDTAIISKAGKFYTISEILGNSAEVTVAKGNKLKIEGGSDFKASDKRKVSVSKKGVIKAKKASEENKVTYTDADGETITIIVNVVEPSISGEKRLKANIAVGSTFDIPLSVPLNAEFGTVKNNTILDSVTEKIEGDSLYHIKGEALKKGTAKLQFTVNGKKYKLRIRVR